MHFFPFYRWKGIRKRKVGTNEKTSATKTHWQIIPAKINVNHLYCRADGNAIFLIYGGGRDAIEEPESKEIK